MSEGGIQPAKPRGFIVSGVFLPQPQSNDQIAKRNQLKCGIVIWPLSLSFIRHYLKASLDEWLFLFMRINKTGMRLLKLVS